MSATFSRCLNYRYVLTRGNAGKPGLRYAFFGVNGSTADGVRNDPTVKKLKGFTNVWGIPYFEVGNVFAWRATDVRELGRVDDPVGEVNAIHLDNIITAADVLVPMWGNTSKVPERLRHHFDVLKSRISAEGKPVKVFGFTKSGDPMHPLMLSYTTPLQDWKL